MGDHSDSVGTGSPIAKRWLWVVRIAALVPALAVVAFNVWVWAPWFKSVCAADYGPIAVAFVILAIPYFVCLRCLWGKSLKKGLAWAVVSGGFWFAFPFFIFVLNVADGVSRVTVATGVLWLWHAALVGAAIKAYYSLSREDDDGKILWGRILRLVPYIAVVFVILVNLPGLLRSRVAAGRAAAVGNLRKITTAESIYQDRFKKGYSPTLRSLGPPGAGEAASASAANLIDELLAEGTKSEHKFTYTPAPADMDGAIASFTVTAAPSDSACTEWRRFFADETGAVRWTQENRPATRGDPKIE